MSPQEKVLSLSLDLDSETVSMLSNLPAEAIRIIKSDLEDALKNRVAVFTRCDKKSFPGPNEQ